MNAYSNAYDEYNESNEYNKSIILAEAVQKVKRRTEPQGSPGRQAGTGRDRKNATSS